MDKRYRHFCTKCEMGVAKKDIKRHRVLNHEVIKIDRKSKKNKKESFEDFKTKVLEDLKK